MPDKICTLCGDWMKSTPIPGIHFTALDGAPFVCERCVARALGVERPWADTHAEDLQRTN